ncbi:MULTISPECIES: hydrogenase maturation nickel metallochaperone HypA [Prosthecochloris]|uniref:Hydrogenase maturation factor HypA n=1 Tax=Prosthecochloris vibrioformis TaxID=1098 RepID=A0A5C4S4C5_PROVB|nr:MULTISPECIES: hydrogenase maturation nickel metallochaperone HypA [Prosthecochloris]ANT65540.1 hydrogenase nickel incorporation protein [Prosthecochloris sp. CIB 2401]TNJ38078.1 hydrogenase maturation nickel metallochaperone HypA [Prosthecochloris vibrioformis]
MHELSIARSIIGAVHEEASRQGATSVLELELVVGPLSGVEIPSLEFGLQVLSRGSVLEHAALHITSPKAEGRCLDCATCFGLEFHYAECPSCGSFRTEVLSGRELKISSIVIE